MSYNDSRLLLCIFKGEERRLETSFVNVVYFTKRKKMLMTEDMTFNVSPSDLLLAKILNYLVERIVLLRTKSAYMLMA